MPRSSSKPPRPPLPKRWHLWPDERLLEIRICDLPIRIEGSILEERLDRLYEELERKGIQFRPHAWLSAEWFSPDGVPGIAVPFYLAHPTLMRLERRQMLEAEGGNERWCMKILRHEAAHALDTAYRLHRRKRWRELFGRYSERYPEFYAPKPFSHNYVQHLDWWYAQAHPAEDFAETFAVWLTPGSDWRRRYQGWPALRKLKYIDTLMASLKDEKPAVRSRRFVEPLRDIRITLRKHYQEKRKRYSDDWPDFYDEDLRRLFSDDLKYAHKPPAATFLNRIRPDIREVVAKWTGEYAYVIDQVMREMVDRCRELKLRVAKPQSTLKIEATIMVTVQTMHFLHSGKHRLAL